MTSAWARVRKLGGRVKGAVERRIRERMRSRTPKRFATNRQAVERGQAAWTCVLPAEVQDWGEPQQCGGGVVDFRPMLAGVFPEQGLLDVADGRIIGPDAWVFAPDDTLLHELSWYCQETRGIRVPRDLRTTRTVRGTCLSLASTWASKSYGHFVFDALVRGRIVELAGKALNDYDAVVLPTPNPGPATDMVARLGVDPARVIWADDGLALRADRLVVPSFPGHRRNYPRWGVTYLRTLMGVATEGSGSRRLYVSRRGYTRNTANEDELVAMLRRHDVEPYDPMASPRQIQDFNECALVIGASGSALTNAAFCRPGTLVIEFVPTDHVFPYYFTMCRSGDLRYRCVVCPSASERRDRSMFASDADFTVPVAAVESILAEAGA